VPGEAFVLFREFLRSPTTVATLTASSDALVAALLRPFPTGADPVVVELGPGSGRVTGAVQRRLRGRGHHLAVELNPRLAEGLAARYPAVDVACADAAALPDLLAGRGLGPVDLVVGLLPWAAYRAAPVPRLVADALAPDGAFTQVVLGGLRRLPPARRIDREVRAEFADVVLSPPVWRNLPPAHVRTARSARPRPGAA
jgi:phosphatidylethanolamine/phosphatidyl-N-methylethanolamine N-methyltransferase